MIPSTVKLLEDKFIENRTSDLEILFLIRLLRKVSSAFIEIKSKEDKLDVCYKIFNKSLYKFNLKISIFSTTKNLICHKGIILN